MARNDLRSGASDTGPWQRHAAMLLSGVAHRCHLKSSSASACRQSKRGLERLSVRRRRLRNAARELGGGRSRATTARSRPLPPRLTGAAPPPTFARHEPPGSTPHHPLPLCAAGRFGPHRAMLRPRDSHDLKLRSAVLTVAPAAAGELDARRVRQLDHPARVRRARPAELRIESRIELEQFPLDQPDYRLASRCRALAVRLRRRGAARPRPDPRPPLSRTAIWSAPGRWTSWAARAAARSSC